MDNHKFSVLLIEDNPGDALLIKEMLNSCEGVYNQIEIFESLKEIEVNYSKTDPDVLLIDLSLPDSKGINTFIKVKELYGYKPLIVLSGYDSEETALIAVQKGAQDYLVKGKIDEIILNRSILYAIERKKLESAVKESDQNFKLLADNAPMFIWMADKTGKAIYFNKRWLKFVGKTIEEIEGKDWMGFIHENDKALVNTTYIKAYKNKEFYNIEYRLKGGNGEYICIVEKGAPHYDLSNKFIGFIGSCLDITERKKAELEIERSKQKYKFLTKNSSDVIWALDLQFKTIYVSPSIKNFLGYSVEDFLQLSTDKYLTKHSFEYTQKVFAKAIEDYYSKGINYISNTENIELEFISKNKKIVHGEINAKTYLGRT